MDTNEKRFLFVGPIFSVQAEKQKMVKIKYAKREATLGDF